jgi:hypothetical protein
LPAKALPPAAAATGEAAAGEAATGEVAAAGSLSLVRPADRKPATAMLRPMIRLEAFI